MRQQNKATLLSPTTRMEQSGFSVGTFLRHRRQQGAWSLSQVARKAGVVKSTLSKWENEQVQPRLPELLSVLQILEVSTSDRVALLQRSGYAVSQPQSPASHRSETFSPPRTFPVHGDLLKAMRHRAQLSQQEAAQRAKIAQGTLAKWENGSDWPNPERLHNLAFTLGATSEETAVLTTGSPTLFSSRNDLCTADNIEEYSQESDTLLYRTYEFPFEPHDLWFLSLLSRLWPASLREDAIGDNAFFLWAKVSYLYLVWLRGVERFDKVRLAPLFLERVRPVLGKKKDGRLWLLYTWVALQEATITLESTLFIHRNFMQGRKLPIVVPSRAIHIAQSLSNHLSGLAASPSLRSQHEHFFLPALCHAEMTEAFLLAMEGGNRERAAELDAHAAPRLISSFVNQGAEGKIHIEMRSAEIHFFRGDYEKALDLVPEMMPAPENTAGFSHHDQLFRLDQIRFRARALLETNKSSQKEEAHHLLEVFDQEVTRIPEGATRTSLEKKDRPDKRP